MKFKRLLLETILVLGIVGGVALWQGRTLVAGKAPALRAHITTGAVFDLAAQDQPTLVYFWGTWCPVCRLTSPGVAAVAAHHRVITVALQSGDAAAINAFLAKKGLTFPVLADPDGMIAARWGVRGVPTIFVVDRRGIIRFTSVGYSSRWGMEARLWAASLR